MVDPAKHLVGKGTARLTFAIMSKDEDNAVSVLGMDIQKGLLNSPYFIDNISKKLSFSNLTKGGVEITDNILLVAGSKVGTVVGKDLYACAYDEINMPSPNIAEGMLVKKRMETYNHILDRKESTLSKAPPMSGIIWMMSSPTEDDDVIGERITEVYKNQIPDVRVLDNMSRWECRNEFSDHTFDFYLGSDTKDPEILDKDSDYSRFEPEKILKIPYKQEYYVAFKDRPVEAIRDIAGRRTTSDAALFNSVSIFPKVFCKDNDIFTKDLLTINFSTDIKVLDIKDYLYNIDYFKNCKDRDCYRYIHLDIASCKDRFGLASVYSNMIKFKSEDGIEINKRIYFVDFCIGVYASVGCVVDLIKVLEWVYGLKKEGYPLKLVTSDSHQGILARQIIQRNGVNTEYLSVESTKEPYYNMKNLILTESLVGYKNNTLIKELGGLRDFQRKIDKSKGNTDDLAGALAGALFSCTTDKNFKSKEESMKCLLDIQKDNSLNNSLIDIYSLDDLNQYNNMYGNMNEYNIADQFNNSNNNRLGKGY
jgi:hypothetical protein